MVCADFFISLHTSTCTAGTALLHFLRVHWAVSWAIRAEVK